MDGSNSQRTGEGKNEKLLGSVDGSGGGELESEVASRKTKKVASFRASLNQAESDSGSDEGVSSEFTLNTKGSQLDSGEEKPRFYTFVPKEERSCCQKIGALLKKLLIKLQFIRFSPGMQLEADSGTINTQFTWVSVPSLVVFIACLLCILVLIFSKFSSIGTKVMVANQFQDPSITHVEIDRSMEDFPLVLMIDFSNENEEHKTLDAFYDKYEKATGETIDRSGPPPDSVIKTICKNLKVGLLEFPFNQYIQSREQYIEDFHWFEFKCTRGPGQSKNSLPIAFSLTSAEEVEKNIQENQDGYGAQERNSTFHLDVLVYQGETFPFNVNIPLSNATDLTFGKGSQISIVSLQVVGDIMDDLLVNIMGFNLKSEYIFSSIYLFRLGFYPTTTENQVTKLSSAITVQPRIEKNHNRLEEGKEEIGFFPRVVFAIKNVLPFFNHTSVKTTLQIIPSGNSIVNDPRYQSQKNNFFGYYLDQRFPYEVQETTYFSTVDFLTTLGGFTSLFQTGSAIVASLFVYRLFSKFMAKQIYLRKAERNRIDFSEGGQRNFSQAHSAEEEKEKLDQIQACFHRRISCEGLYLLFDEVQVLKKRVSDQEDEIRELREELALKKEQ